MIKGFKIPLLSPIQGNHPFQIHCPLEEAQIISQEVSNMLEKKAIVEVSSLPETTHFSQIFVVPKKDGGFRPIINLRKLNNHVPYEHFKMESLKDVKDLIQPGDFMAKIDLKDAFFHVPLARESRHLTAFHWQGRSFLFKAMCFGLAPAPRVFTKLAKVPMALLRHWGIRAVIYLDILILFARSKESMNETIDLVLCLFKRLGYTINHAKSILMPVQKLVYLGIFIDSVQMTFELPPQKSDELTNLCNSIVLSEGIPLSRLTRRPTCPTLSYFLTKCPTFPKMSYFWTNLSYLSYFF